MFWRRRLFRATTICKYRQNFCILKIYKNERKHIVTARIKTVTYFYGHYKFVCIVHHTSSFIGDCKYGFFSLDYSVKMC